MINQIYQTIFFIASILLYPCLKFNSKLSKYLPQRYAVNSVPVGEWVWFHFASLGELQGAKNIICIFREKQPNQKILITSTSASGHEEALKIADHASLLPFDSSFYYSRFLKQAKIKKFIFGETELWPGLLRYLSKRVVPMYLINARLSPNNYSFYQKFKVLFSDELKKIKKIFCIDDQHKIRFVKLGAREDQLVISGNLKYDNLNLKQSQKIHNHFEDDRPVVVFSCMHPEELWLIDLVKDNHAFNFILAPRHLEKLNKFTDYLKEKQISYNQRSGGEARWATNLLLLDSIGELSSVYSFAKISIICGTFFEGPGGHSPMEAAAKGNLILMGEYYVNQLDCVSELQKAGGVKIINAIGEIQEFLANYKNNLQMGSQAKKVSDSYQGKSLLVYQEIFNS